MKIRQLGRGKEPGLTRLAHPNKQVLQEMRKLRSDPKYFEQGRPMGLEVLQWLQVLDPEEKYVSFKKRIKLLHTCIGT